MPKPISPEQVEELRERLELAEQTLSAIRQGRVDALVVEAPDGDRVYTLTGADRTYRVMVEEMQEGAMVLRADGAILYCNRQVADILRVPAEKLLGSSFFDWVAPPTRTSLEEIAAGRPYRPVRIEGHLRAADATHVPVYLAVNPLPVGEALFISVVVTDLTELKQHEARLEQRTGELAAANQELETFSYSVSHDLRAPLRHITGFIEMLQDRAAAGLDDESRRYIGVITKSAGRMNRLIDDLLALSRLGRSAMTTSEIDLGELLCEAIEELAAETAGRRIDWHLGPLPGVRGDRGLLKTVLVNLLSNAVKYTRPRDPARIEVGGHEQNAEVVCFVRDNGVGFDMRFAHKLFGVFQRLHPAREFEGTGIGLASVQRVVGRHGGRTWAEGSVGGGAAFYFSLPRQQVQP